VRQEEAGMGLTSARPSEAVKGGQRQSEAE
jgi:hypothetical protein